MTPVLCKESMKLQGRELQVRIQDIYVVHLA